MATSVKNTHPPTLNLTPYFQFIVHSCQRQFALHIHIQQNKTKYHIWDKKRRQKRRVKKATGKKSDLFLIFRGKIRYFVFFAIFDFFFGEVAFFTLYRFFYQVAFFTFVFAFFTGLPKTLCRRGFPLLECSLSNVEIFFAFILPKIRTRH